MFKIKHFGLASVLTLCAVGAMASNFRSADQVYIPNAGHVAGGSGTFITDVWVKNLTSDTVSVSVIYTPTGGGVGGDFTKQPQFFDNVISLQANEQKEFIDFFPNVIGQQSGFGALVFNACKSGADCTAVDANGVSANFRNISVFSRIYVIPPGTSLGDAVKPETRGFAFAGIPWFSYVSSRSAALNLGKVVIMGVRNTGAGGTAGTYRTNIGLMNASQFSTTTIIVRLFSGAATQIGSDFAVTLAPLNHFQASIQSMFSAFGPAATSTDAYVTVEQTNNVPTADAGAAGCGTDGCPGFLAYGAILDNLGGDGTTLEPTYTEALTDAALSAIYGSNSAGKPNLRRAVKPH